jgi:type I restriction enzyme S subunit
MEMKSRRTNQHDSNWQDDESVDVPDSWSIATLGMITKNLDGQRVPIKSKDRSNRQGQYPYYGASGIIDTIDDFLFDGDFLLIAEDGANLLSRSTPIAFRANGRFWVNNHAHVVQTLGGMPLDYLQAYLNGQSIEYFITGSAQPKLTQESMNNIPVPIAPLAEQIRIVKKIETLLGQVNRVRDRLSRVPAILKRFRQAVLAAACSGRLTEDWREKHVDIESAETRWNLSGLTPMQADSLPELPESWVYRRLEHISERVSVGHVGPTSQHYCSKEMGVPFVRSQNVRPGRLEMDDVMSVTPAFHRSLKKSQLKAGDLLIVRVGANRGDACVVPPDIGPLNCANIVFARPFSGISEYLEAYCQSTLGQSLLLDMTTGSAQGVINTTAAAELPIPIPPGPEQEEILRRVAGIFEPADAIERRVYAVTIRANRLAQSILAKAFRGELVPTEAELARREGREYEPASLLLERIKKEREGQPSSKRERRAVRPKTKLATAKGQAV